MVGIGYFTSELVDARERIPDWQPMSASRPALWDALFAVAGNKTGQLDAAGSAGGSRPT